MNNTIERIKNALTTIIKESRGPITLLPNEVTIDSLHKKNNHYEIMGSYKYTNIFGVTLEEGSFKIVLDEKLEPIEIEIKPKSK